MARYRKKLGSLWLKPVVSKPAPSRVFSFQGMALGGPLAGQTITAEAPTYVVRYAEPFTYDWHKVAHKGLPGGELAFWVPAGMGGAYVFTEMARVYHMTRGGIA